jgi:hypothetical protein
MLLLRLEHTQVFGGRGCWATLVALVKTEILFFDFKQAEKSKDF